MLRNKSLQAVLALALMFSLFLTACGGASSSTSNTAQSTTSVKGSTEAPADKATEAPAEKKKCAALKPKREPFKFLRNHKES